MNELLFLPEYLLLAFTLLVCVSGLYLTIKFLPVLPLGFLLKLPFVLKSMLGNLDPGPAGNRLSPGRAWVLALAFDTIPGAGLGAFAAWYLAGDQIFWWLAIFSGLVASLNFAVAAVARSMATAGGVLLQLIYAVNGIAFPLLVCVLVNFWLGLAYALLAPAIIFWVGRRGVPRAGFLARYAFVAAVLLLLFEITAGLFSGALAWNSASGYFPNRPPLDWWHSWDDRFTLITAIGVYLAFSGAGSLRVLSYATLNASRPGPLAAGRMGLAFVAGPTIALISAAIVLLALKGGQAHLILDNPLGHLPFLLATLLLCICGLVGAYMASEIGSRDAAPAGLTLAADSAYGFRATSRGRVRAILWSSGALAWFAVFALLDHTTPLRFTIYAHAALAAITGGGAILYAYLRTPRVERALRALRAHDSWRSDLGRDLQLLLFHLLPTNLVSRLFGHIAELRLPAFLLHPLLRWYAKTFNVNLDEAAKPLTEYASLNLFFTRELKPGLRPIDQRARTVVSPVDGVLSRFGAIDDGTLIQAKGLDYRLEDLLAGSEFVPQFQGGHYAVIYLSPRDYHRIHSQVGGEVVGYDYVPGRLFPVNLLAVSGIADLFPKNERLTTYVQNEHGLTALVKVGATNVGKISVVYDSAVQANRWIRRGGLHRYSNHERIEVGRGEELARFEMGSTVVLLFEKGRFTFDASVVGDQPVVLGQAIGRLSS